MSNLVLAMNKSKNNLLIKKESYRLWFEFYRLGLANKTLTPNKVFYEQWGDVSNIKFDDWWKTHSRLFEQPIVKVVKSEDEMESPNGILIEVPMNKSVTDTLKDIKEILTGYEKKKRKSKKVLIGRFQLTEDSEPKLRVIREILNVYRDVYRKSDKILKGQKLYQSIVTYYTSRKRKNTLPPQLIGLKDNPPNPSSVRTVGRWIKKGKSIEKNVSLGMFPGKY